MKIAPVVKSGAGKGSANMTCEDSLWVAKMVCGMSKLFWGFTTWLVDFD